MFSGNMACPFESVMFGLSSIVKAIADTVAPSTGFPEGSVTITIFFCPQPHKLPTKSIIAIALIIRI